jgi:hypothetical protein
MVYYLMRIRNSASNKLVFHEGGSLSIRINGRWRERVRKLTEEEFLALPYPDRERLVMAEYERSRSLIIGHKPVVVKNKRRSYANT